MGPFAIFGAGAIAAESSLFARLAAAAWPVFKEAGKGVALYLTTDAVGTYLGGWFGAGTDPAAEKAGGFRVMADESKSKKFIKMLRRAFYFARYFAQKYPDVASDACLWMLRRIMGREEANVASRVEREYAAAMLVAHDMLYNTKNGNVAPDIISEDAIAPAFFNPKVLTTLFEPSMFSVPSVQNGNLLQYINMQFCSVMLDLAQGSGSVTEIVQYPKADREAVSHVFCAKYSTALEYVLEENPVKLASATAFASTYGMGYVETLNRMRGSNAFGPSQGSNDIFNTGSFLEVAALVTNYN